MITCNCVDLKKKNGKTEYSYTKIKTIVPLQLTTTCFIILNDINRCMKTIQSIDDKVKLNEWTLFR